MNMHLCGICKQNPATVHQTDIEAPNKKVETHLCETCAGKQGLVPQLKAMPLADVIGVIVDPKLKEVQELLERKCPECGISWPEFRAKGRLGCPADYDLFEKGLNPLLEKIHGATQHVGKIPGSRGGEMELEKELTKLKQELGKSIKREEYEKAAELRDRIHEIERTIEGKKDGPR